MDSNTEYSTNIASKTNEVYINPWTCAADFIHNFLKPAKKLLWVRGGAAKLL